MGFRTVVTYEVLTEEEAFNGGAEMLGDMVRDGSARAVLTARSTEEVSPRVFYRLQELQDQTGDLQQ